MYILNLILPFILFITISFFGYKLGKKGVYYISIISILLLLLINLILYYEIILDGNILLLNINNWINLDILNINIRFLFDDLSVTMLIVITSVSLVVLIYSYDYMINDPHIIRFYSYIVLFIISMIILITNSSLIWIFVGWEAVGLSSFLLISYWFNKLDSNIGALIAILMNRIGDIFFLLGIFLSIFIIGSNDILTILSYPIINNEFILLSLFIAAMAKSAQLYLHIWLPYSMEGPTPISSLIHAATMVTAGVFLLIRLSLLISYSYYSIIIITIIGALTTFIGGSLALTALDIKELIAYSTMSQLGYMITILGLKFSNLGFFHLVFHAYFKALLFLTAGSIIHTFLDLQDLRYYGSFISFLPLSYLFLLIGLTSLSGFPFTTGFYSKEAIINSSFLFNSYEYIQHIFSNYVYSITLLTAFFTILYSFKLIITTFFDTSRSSLFVFKNIHYYSLHLTLSLIILSIFTIIIGFLFNKFIYLYNFHISFFNHNIPLIIKIIPLIFFVIVILILFTNIFKLHNIIIDYFGYFTINQFFFTIFYQTIAGTILSLSYRVLFKIFDYGILDLLSPITGHILYNYSLDISKFLNNTYYISLFLFSVFIFISIL